jgi:hypothetical protein
MSSPFHPNVMDEINNNGEVPVINNNNTDPPVAKRMMIKFVHLQMT